MHKKTMVCGQNIFICRKMKIASLEMALFVQHRVTTFFWFGRIGTEAMFERNRFDTHMQINETRVRFV